MSATVQAQPAPPAVVYSRDVAPIIRAKCAGCHRPGGDAPFALTSYDEVRPRAATIRAVTRQRYMPPWKPVGPPRLFHGDRRLTDREIDTIAQWIDGGAPPGSPYTGPAAPAPALIPPPDMELALPEYTLRADGPDVFRNFVIAVPISAMRYVRGLRFAPHSAGVHHANIRVDPTSASAELDARDPAPGYEGLVLRSADFPGGHFLGWTPGQLDPVLSDETAWRIDPGSSLVVQLHLRPTGRPERIAPVIGLYFGTRAPSRLPSMIRIGRQDLAIPAGDANLVVTDSFTLPVDAELRAVQPHAHYRARRLAARARLPNGSVRELIRIDDWDVHWQDRYAYADPFWLPAGTTITLEFAFDNSSANVRNPVTPPQDAGWGWRSVDEMADLWIQVMTRSDQDRQRLEAAARRKMLTEDAVGSEQVLAREPDHADLHNDVALIYMSLGEPTKALAHFATVTRLRPGSAQARYNEGVALEALGDDAGAAGRYRDALLRSPEYAAAHNNLGALLLRSGDVAQARTHLERAIADDPRNMEAHANLATVLIAAGEPDAAIGQIDAVATAAPARLRSLSPLIVFLAAHPDSSKRRPMPALRLAEQLVRQGRDASALDTLAVALAGTGDFQSAVQAATDALALLEGDAADRAAIQERLATYRAGRPFVLRAATRQ